MNNRSGRLMWKVVFVENIDLVKLSFVDESFAQNLKEFLTTTLYQLFFQTALSETFEVKVSF